MFQLERGIALADSLAKADLVIFFSQFKKNHVNTQETKSFANIIVSCFHTKNFPSLCLSLYRH